MYIFSIGLYIYILGFAISFFIWNFDYQIWITQNQLPKRSRKTCVRRKLNPEKEDKTLPQVQKPNNRTGTTIQN